MLDGDEHQLLRESYDRDNFEDMRERDKPQLMSVAFTAAVERSAYRGYRFHLR